MDFARTSRRVRTVALISLIDVMFFILVFFMFSTSFMHGESLELRVPEAQAIQRQSPIITIYLSGEGTIKLGDEILDLRGLDREVRQRLLLNPQKRIQVLSDETASVQQLVTVMDILYRHGGQNVSLAKWIRQPVTEAPNGI